MALSTSSSLSSVSSPSPSRRPPLMRSPKDFRIVSKISGNVADGHAIQQNGDSIERQTIRIYNLSIGGNLTVNARSTSLQDVGWQCLMDGNHPSNKYPSHTTAARPGTPQSAGSSGSGDSLISSVRPATRPAIAFLGQVNPFMLVYANHSATKSATGGKVSIDRYAQGNWIRRAILRRLDENAPPEQHDSTLRQVTHNGKLYQSHGTFVDFTCRKPRRPGSECRHRFYVLDHADFDVLIGKAK